jgi:hypothetical protein
VTYRRDDIAALKGNEPCINLGLHVIAKRR